MDYKIDSKKKKEPQQGLDKGLDQITAQAL